MEPDETEADLTGATPRRRPRPVAREIGGRRLKPSTLMMGHGYDPMLSEGSPTGAGAGWAAARTCEAVAGKEPPRKAAGATRDRASRRF